MTKRLFAYIGLSMLITFSVVFYFGIYGLVSAVSSAAVVLVFALFKGGKSKRVFVLIAAVIMFSAAYFQIYSSVKELNAAKYTDKNVTVTAAVSDYHKTKDNYYYELKCLKINSNTEGYKILLKSSADLGASYGDVITCDVKLKKMSNSYYKSKGYDFNAFSESYFLSYWVKRTTDKGIGYVPVYIRNSLLHSIRVLLPGGSGELSGAITLGDKFGLSEKLYKDFKSTGLSYLIVISGLHMSLVAAFIYFFTKRLKNSRAGRTLRLFLIIFFIFVYMAVTGFASSATRSGIMIIILSLGQSFRYKSDTVNNLGLAAFLLTLFNPFAVGDAGMLMSFSSTAGIIFIAPHFRNLFDSKFDIRIKNLFALNGIAANIVDKVRINFKLSMYRLLRAVYEMFSISICAVIAITPLTLMFYGVCNPFVIIYSIFISPFIGILMLFSVLSAVLWYIPFLNILSYATALITRAVAAWIIFFVGIIADIPYHSFYAEPFYMKIWMGITIALFIIAAAMKLSRRRIIIASGLSLVLLLSNICIGYVVNYDKTELKVIESGGGSAVVLKTPDTVDVLSSGGSGSMYDDFSEKLRIDTDRINTMIVQSPYERADVEFAANILDEFDVQEVMLYYRYNINERVYRLANSRSKCRRLKEDGIVSVRLSDTVTDTLINSGGHTWQYISDGKTSALIAPYKGEVSEVPEKYYNPDYLILNNYIDNIGNIKYGEVIWTSNRKLPNGIKNIYDIADGDFKIALE